MTPTEQLLAHLLGRPWAQCAGRPVILDEDQRQWLQRALERLRAGEPVGYITGSAPFLDWEIRVGPGVFIPRSDTEAWVAVWLTEGPRPHRIQRGLDIGTGSGCLAAVLADRYPEAVITALDVSPRACSYARENFNRLNLADRIRLIQTDAVAWLADHHDDRYEVVLCNPPYVPRGRWPHLPETVKHEPVTALDGGEDGLEMTRRIMPLVPKVLSDDGVFVVEIDDGAQGTVTALADAAGLRCRSRIHDLTGVVRALVFSLKPD